MIIYTAGVFDHLNLELFAASSAFKPLCVSFNKKVEGRFY